VIGAQAVELTDECDRRDDVDVEDSMPDFRVKAVEAGERRDSERAGVVDQEPDGTQPLSGVGERSAVPSVGDVTGDADPVGQPGELGRRGVEPISALGIDHQSPARLGECPGEGEAQALGSAGDHGDRLGAVRVRVVGHGRLLGLEQWPIKQESTWFYAGAHALLNRQGRPAGRSPRCRARLVNIIR
jgi:hypothetical protein